MSRPLRALIVEDSADDATRLLLHLEQAGFDVVLERVQTETSLRSALRRQTWDVVLSDFAMPGFDGLAAFEVIRKWDSDLPFIFVSGNVGEERAAEAMKRGASDYVLKNNLSRLVPAVLRELQDVEVRRQRRQMAEELKQSEKRYRTLVESSLQGIAIVEQARIVFSNPAFERMFSYTSPEELAELPDYTHLFTEADRPRIAALMGGPRDARELAQAQEFLGVRKGGALVALQVIVWPVTWDNFPAHQLVTIDITDRRRAEDELQSQKRLLQTVFDSLPLHVTVKDPRRHYVLVNRRAEELSGLPAGELIGRTREVQGVGTPEELARIDELDRQVLETGEPHRDRAFAVTLRDGTVHRYDVIRVPLLSADRRVEGLVSITQDVTEQIRADEALRAQRRLLQTVFDSLPLWVAVKDVQERYVLFNRLFRESLGMTEADMLGKQYREFGVGTPEEISRMERMDREVLRTGRAYDFPLVTKTLADGRDRSYHVVRAPLRDENDRVEGLVIVTQDVTESHQAGEEVRRQQRLMRTVFDSLPLYVVVKDKDLRYVAVNARFARDFGPDERAFLGKRVGEVGIFTADSLPTVEALEREVMETGRRREDRRLPVRFGDGTSHIFDTLRAPLVDENGAIEGLVIVSHDVTESVGLEEQFRQSQKMESIGLLAGGVAHDFNNMLSVILSCSEFLLDELPADSPLKAEVVEIRESGQRSAALTRQLLAFSRRQIFELKPVQLNDLVAGLQKFYGRLVGENIQVTMALEPGAPAVIADEGQVEQVLMNLVVNARDAMPHGGKILLETKSVSLDADYAEGHFETNPGRYVQLSVTDTGSGMDAAIQARIFEPFFTTKGKGRGTGLGLATVYGIVKQLGGNIWVYSEVGKGTSFKIYLPVSGAEHATVTPAHEASTAERGSESILLVEDDPSVRRAAKRILDDAGYRVREAGSAEEAWALLEREAVVFDLLVTDVVLPEQDGKQLADRVRRRIPDIRVLFMSGYTDHAVVQNGELGLDAAFLQKPFSRASMLERIRKALEQTR